MLREKMIKNKRIRIGRILPAAAAAVFAVCGLGSCAALEMLDSLAAEEENTVHTAPAAKPENSQQASAAAPGQEDAPAPDAQKPADDGASAAKNDSTAVVTASPVESVIGQIESVVAPGTPADGTAAEQPAAEAGAVSLPEVTIGGGSAAPGNSTTGGDSSTGSLITDIAGSGVDPADGTGDMYTEGGFTTESGAAETSVQNAAQTAGLPVYLAYSELVDKYASYTAKDHAYKPEYCRYYITDIDNSGVPEILIETGTIETDRTIYVYTFDGGSAELLGNFVAWHTRLGDGDGVIYTETSAMGSYIVSTITIKEGKLFTERGEQPFSESQLKMPLISYSLTDPSALDALK